MLYRPEQVVQLNHPMTNKEKLSLLYGLYHNYCLRQFDRLYNPRLAEGSFGDSQLWAGGTYYSQHPLMIECKNLIKLSKASKQNKFMREGTMNWKEFEKDFMRLRIQLDMFLIR